MMEGGHVVTVAAQQSIEFDDPVSRTHYAVAANKLTDVGAAERVGEQDAERWQRGFDRALQQRLGLTRAAVERSS